MNKFWMVKGVGPTNHQHPTRESAELEAERLANQHPNVPFYVLEATSFRRAVSTMERGDCAEEQPKPTGGWRKMRDWRDIGKTVIHSSDMPNLADYTACDKKWLLQVIDSQGVLVGDQAPWTRWFDKDLCRVWVWDEESDVPF